MKSNEVLSLTGNGKFVLRDEYGNIKDIRIFKNLVVNVGLTFAGNRLSYTDYDPANYIRLGTGTDAVTSGDSSLQTDTNDAKAGTYSSTGTGTWTVVATWSAGESTGAITESGVFFGSTASYMFCRQTFSVINKAANDTLEVTWSFTLANA